MRRLKQLDSTPKQLDDVDNLGRQYKADVLSIRETAGISKGDVAKRDKVYKILIKEDLQDDAFWLRLQKDGGFSDSQRIGFRKTKARSNRFKSDALDLLTESQRSKWRSTAGRNRSNPKQTKNNP